MAAASDLHAQRASTQRLVEDLRAELMGIMAEQEANPPDDEHDVEGSSVGYERARVAALLADAQTRLEGLDAAMLRIATGTYGWCDSCGSSIGDERLVALPTTRRCVACAAGPSSPTISRRTERG